MFLARNACVLLLVCLCACQHWPDSYPPPEQRPPLEELKVNPDSMMVEMAGQDADPRMIRDIQGGAAGVPWRWTSQEPTVKVEVFSPEHLKLSTDFAIWDDGFRQTGPLEISFTVNGRLLQKVSYTTPGVKHFEKPVPPSWLSKDKDATIAFALSKLYVAPQNGVKFGVILVRLGLAPQ
jgi:hypothetical protein